MKFKHLSHVLLICLILSSFTSNAAITDVAFDYSGAFGSNVYVSVENVIYRLNDNGSTEVFYTHSERINSMAFSDNTDFGSNLYLSVGSSGIVKVDQTGSSDIVVSSGNGLMSDIAFPVNTNFDYNLYASLIVGFPGGFVDSIDSLGNISTFSTFGPTILTGLAFGTTAFGNTNLFIADEANANNGEIYSVDPLGNASIFTLIPDKPVNLAVSPGGSFGDTLYVSTFRNGNIYQVDAIGNTSLFSSGFNFANGFTGDMAFDSSGESLYVADNDNLYLLTAGSSDKVLIPFPNPIPVPAAIWLLGSGLIGLFGFARLSVR